MIDTSNEKVFCIVSAHMKAESIAGVEYFVDLTVTHRKVYVEIKFDSCCSSDNPCLAFNYSFIVYHAKIKDQNSLMMRLDIPDCHENKQILAQLNSLKFQANEQFIFDLQKGDDSKCNKLI